MDNKIRRTLAINEVTDKMRDASLIIAKLQREGFLTALSEPDIVDVLSVVDLIEEEENAINEKHKDR